MMSFALSADETAHSLQLTAQQFYDLELIFTNVFPVCFFLNMIE